jgi:hypothetical protein
LYLGEKNEGKDLRAGDLAAVGLFTSAMRRGCGSVSAHMNLRIGIIPISLMSDRRWQLVAH